LYQKVSNSVTRASRRIVALDIKDGTGELEVQHADAWGNPVPGHWRILRDGKELWAPAPFHVTPPALKNGPVDIERDNAYISGHTNRLSGLEVTEGARRRVRIRSHWGVVHVKTYDKSGELSGFAANAYLYRSPYKKDDKPLCRLDWWGVNKLNTPYGETPACLTAELPSGTYDLCIESKGGKHTVWKSFTIGPRQYIEYSFQGS
jgi:hypothetical protein